MSLALMHYHSINQIDANLWNRTFAQDGLPSRTHSFIKNIEASFPQRGYKYYLIQSLDTNDIVGAFFFSQEALDLAFFMPEKAQAMIHGVRKVLSSFMKIHMTHAGTPEIAGSQWWFNWSKITPRQASDYISAALAESFPSSTLMLLRDFLTPKDGEPDLLEFLDCRFETVQSYPYALFNCDDFTEDSYKDRMRIKIRRGFEENYQKALDLGYRVEVTERFDQEIDALYPLYINVANDAKEFQREPFPKSFFVRLAQDEKLKAYATILRAPDNTVVSFILTIVSGDKSNPYFFGKPNNLVPDINIYNLLMWHEMLLSLNTEVGEIDMGITNYFPKQSLGAELHTSKMAISFTGWFKQKLFNRYLPQSLSVSPPQTKRAFKK